jgi:hypothetical protein
VKIKIISSDEELYKFNLFLGKTCETYKNWNKGWQSAVERLLGSRSSV